MWLMAVKAVSELACMIGTEAIVGGIADIALDKSTNKILRTCTKVATVCVGGVMGAAAAKYADETIDETAETIKRIMETFNKKAGDADGPDPVKP